VDGAETPEGRVAAWKVNAEAVSYLSEVARLHGITLVHISSDYVFNGSKEPHTEDEDFSPLSVYGASKAAGDIAASLAPKHYILRTSWVIGEGKNLIKDNHEYGTYNVTNGGNPASWADITRSIFNIAGFDQQVSNTTTAEYFAGKENIAPRPLKSMLDLSKIQAIGFTPTDWRDDLKKYIENEKENS
jgi:dTDP-4-dehydrorhamnose reductase